MPPHKPVNGLSAVQQEVTNSHLSRDREDKWPLHRIAWTKILLPFPSLATAWLHFAIPPAKHSPLTHSTGGPARSDVDIVVAWLDITWVMLRGAPVEVEPLVLFLGLPGHRSIPTSPWHSSTEGKWFSVLLSTCLTQCHGVLELSPQPPHMGLPFHSWGRPR